MGIFSKPLFDTDGNRIGKQSRFSGTVKVDPYMVKERRAYNRDGDLVAVIPPQYSSRWEATKGVARNLGAAGKAVGEYAAQSAIQNFLSKIMGGG